MQRFYKETFLFFDEIQDCKEALNTLKYFREDAPEYDMVNFPIFLCDWLNDVLPEL